MTRQQSSDVLVIGEAVIDIVIDANGRPEHHVGGSPANVALGLGRLGQSATLLTQFGDDHFGQLIRSHLEASSVSLATIGAPTNTSTAVARIVADGNAAYEFDISWNAFSPPPDLPRARVIHTGSIAAFLEPGASSLREFLRARQGAEICFDPNIRPALVGSPQLARQTFEETARLSTVVKMSDEDAQYLYADDPVENVLDEVLSHGPKLAIITLGAQGAILATPHFRISVKSWPVNVVDTIGAGDTFMAAVIDALLDGTELDPQGLRYIGDHATHLAGITVSRAGADLPTSADRFYQRDTTHWA